MGIMRRRSDLEKLLSNKGIKMVVAFLVPVFVMLFLYYGVGIYPYKSKSVLMSDFSGQYINFLAYIKDAVFSGNGFFYSFAKTMGGDMVGMSAYYLFSPLNIFFLLVSKSSIVVWAMIITIIKIGLASFGMFLLLSEKGGYYYKNIIFTVAYAISGYVISFAFNIMWLDSVYLAPILIWTIERLFHTKKNITYILVLFLTVVTCYYTGYMVCLFAFLYVIYRIVAGNESIKQKIKVLLNLAISTVIGIGLSAIVLIPAISSQNSSRAIGGEFETSFKANHSVMEFLNGMFNYNGSKYSLDNNLPYVFFSIPLLVLLVSFFFNRKIKIREKFAALFVLVVFVIATMFPTLDSVFHGFAQPNQFYFRYSFLFILMALIVAYRSMQHIDGINNIRVYIVTFLVTLAGLVLCIFTVYKGMSLNNIIINVVLIIITILVLYQVNNTELELAAVPKLCLFVLVMVSLLFQANEKMYTHDYADISLEGYVNELEPCIDYIKKDEDDFYRLEKTFNNSLNDAMLLNYYGLSHFSSSDNPDIIKFMENMGYTRNQDFWSYYGKGSTLGADSILGVKYILSRKKLDKPLDLVATYDNIDVYKNTKAVSLLFGAYGKDKKRTTNIFENTNNIYKAFTGEKDTIYKKIGGIDTIRESDNCIHYTIKVYADGYFYMAMPLDKECGLMNVHVNGRDLGEFYSTYQKGVLAIGKYSRGNTLDIMIDYKSAVVEPLFYREDIKVLDKYSKLLNSKANKVELLTNSHIKANVELKKDGRIVSSIPYDDNWHITLDGKRVKNAKSQGCLLAIDGVAKGEHMLELKYVPRNLKISLYIFGVAVVLLIIDIIVVCLIDRKRKKTEEGDESYEVQ